jgi:hypothetical protein
MKINLFGRQTLASLIITVTINFIKFKFKKFDIDEITLWKFYYEFNKFIERSPLKSISSEEEFTLLMVEVLKLFEKFFEERTKKDPDFMNKLLKQNSYLWSIYKFFSDFINRETIFKIINNPLSSELQEQVNKKIIETPELLDYKVKRDVDYAIKDYEKLESPPPINMTNEVILKDLEKNSFSETQKKIVKDAVYSEKEPDGSVAQSLLGGEMRIQFKPTENND